MRTRTDVWSVLVPVTHRIVELDIFHTLARRVAESSYFGESVSIKMMSHGGLSLYFGAQLDIGLHIRGHQHDGALRQMLRFELKLRDDVESSILDTMCAKRMLNKSRQNPK